MYIWCSKVSTLIYRVNGSSHKSCVRVYTYTHNSLPVSEVFCLLASSDELYNGVEELVTFVLLLFLQYQHEVLPEAGLHHHPVHSPGQVDVCRQEHYVLTCNTHTVRPDIVYKPYEMWIMNWNKYKLKTHMVHHFQSKTNHIYDFGRPYFCSLLFFTHPVIYLPIQNGFYPSKWQADGCLHKAVSSHVVYTSLLLTLGEGHKQFISWICWHSLEIVGAFVESSGLTLQCGDALVLLHEVWHHLLQRPLPLTRRTRARTAVGSETKHNTYTWTWEQKGLK